MARKQSVLILCTHNAARSQMAEGWLRHLAGDRFEVHSAGLEPTEVHPLAIEAMREVGVDISDHEAKPVKQYMGRLTAHYLIIVCSDAEKQCPRMFPGMLHRLFWPFEDPSTVEGTAGEKLETFRQTRDAIKARVEHWLAQELTNEASSEHSQKESS
jgi:arsenate reductase